MKILDFPIKKNINILALGAESVGIFAVYQNGNVFISENFGDLLDEDNFLKYKKTVLGYLKKGKIKPDVILTDLHPLFNTTILGGELAERFNAKHIKVQHHIAHIFSAVGDFLLPTTHYPLPTNFIGLAMDGTGYGLDGNIWGGEAFRLQMANGKWQMAKIQRIGSLEEQIMIGGDLAVKEPARMLIAILARIMNYELGIMNKTHPVKYSAKRNLTGQENKKIFIYRFVKKFYTRNEFEMLYNQMEQDFNCQKTTSTGRILDAVSVLLGFAGNERGYKHQASKLLEENSSKAYADLEPQIKSTPTLLFKRRAQTHSNLFLRKDSDIIFSPFEKGGLRGILETTPLFEYLIKNIHKDKKRLSATAQLYIAKGFCELIKPYAISHKPFAIFAAGGMTNNKIISKYLEKQGVYMSKKNPRGDEGIAYGQIIYYLLSKVKL